MKQAEKAPSSDGAFCLLHPSSFSLHPFGSSLLPTIVRFSPTCTVTFTPFTSTTVLPFKYQPREPVENSRGSASMGAPAIATSTGLAPSRNCWRVIGLAVLAISSLLAEWQHAGE